MSSIDHACEEEKTSGVCPQPQSESSGMVRLLQATKIPARYTKMVRVSIDSGSDKDLVLFTPELTDGGRTKDGLTLEDAVLQLGKRKLTDCLP